MSNINIIYVTKQSTGFYLCFYFTGNINTYSYKYLLLKRQTIQHLKQCFPIRFSIEELNNF
jgi:hypothetical protein